MIAVSVVSHGQGQMVERLVAQLRACPEVTRVILTLNIPEIISVADAVGVEIIRNPHPKGFGANHNAAFHQCREPWFCVLNPDIELVGNPFTELLAQLEATGAALAAPRVLAPSGEVEDSARRFPTLLALLRKAFLGDRGSYVNGIDGPPFFPDWVAGMFMLFRSNEFAALTGFDDSYFLYYEDVDICRRIRLRGMRVVVCPAARVIHDARRDSHRKLKYLRWHLSSMLRYLWKYR